MHLIKNIFLAQTIDLNQSVLCSFVFHVTSLFLNMLTIMVHLFRLYKKMYNQHRCKLGLARNHFFRTDTIRYQKFWVSSDTNIDPMPPIRWFFLISVEFLYLSVCWPAHHSFVFYTQSTKYRQLYCKKITTNEWICNYNQWQKYFYKLV